MLVFAAAGISQPPDGNSSSLLTVTLIASCIREICMFLAATSALIVWLSCWYSCSRSVFFCCDSSYFCCDTQPASSSAAPATHSIGNFAITGSPLRELTDLRDADRSFHFEWALMTHPLALGPSLDSFGFTSPDHVRD